MATATAKELDAAVDTLNDVLSRLTEGEPRSHAIAHLRTTSRWAHQAIGVDVTRIMHERDTHKENAEDLRKELRSLRQENAALKGEG